MNAPEAGTIKEFLVSEEDTVTVGQDIIRLELGGSGGEKKESAPKEEAKEVKEEAKEESKPAESESKPEPKEPEPKPKDEPKQPTSSKPKQPQQQSQSSSASAGPTLGSREERRVCNIRIFLHRNKC